MEFMKKFRIQSDCKIPISVHHWLLYTSALCQGCQMKISIKKQTMLNRRQTTPIRLFESHKKPNFVVLLSFVTRNI